MIDNIYDLNDMITAVANRALDIVAERSLSGQYYVDHSDLADLISQEDFKLYAPMIAYELSGRSEVLDQVVLDDGQLDINLGLAYCKSYQWCDGDEEIFGCSYEEWLEMPVEPISHPLSLNRMAEIGYAAVSHIYETRESAISDLTESIGLTAAELKELTGEDITPQPEQAVTKRSLDDQIDYAVKKANTLNGNGLEEKEPER